MPVDNPNVGVAFLLVIGAGLATALGASVVFFPTLVKLASRRVLAAALGLSAGVMTYVSFVEIFPKSSDSFGEAGIEENTSYVYATLCFFGGGIIMLILDFLVKSLSGQSHDHNIPADNKGSGGEIQGQQCFTCSPDPVGDLDRLQNQADSIIRQENDPDEREFDPDKEYDADAPDDTKLQSPKDVYVPDDTKLQSSKDEEDLTKPEENKRLVTMGINTAIAIGLHNFPEGLATFVAALDDPRVGAVLAIAIGIHNIPEGFVSADTSDVAKLQSPKDADVPDDTKLQSSKDEEDLTNEVENKKLVKMGINTAIAIGLHNFPEGLATFVAALNDPRVGAVLAIAIGIHNIPEGLCVALPIYYATGNRMKAFAWALLSGASEPLAALLGWVVLANSFSDTMYAVLFGLVGGMMVIISIRELLPTAHRYDPQDTVVTISFIVGMFIMALSLVLFVI
eukprot:CAMPEP_0194194188 /NCGR_PEP_ID=MMETSP0154-20130528/75444_1 /TAXON_ID=1049557 /ORGANISM="Thalassiothrix antarctica, Strain L6-D1" /LENGTH=452 /DNA_ID=CAMNT_0038918591 /DNA_START=371 /DNA_END=1733 /DNA_ORIENTATION=-